MLTVRDAAELVKAHWGLVQEWLDSTNSDDLDDPIELAYPDGGWDPDPDRDLDHEELMALSDALGLRKMEMAAIYDTLNEALGREPESAELRQAIQECLASK